MHPQNIPKSHHLDCRAGRLLADGTDGPPEQLFTTKQLASWLGVSMGFLEIGRCRGYGPRFVRVSSNRVRYRRVDVVAWLHERMY